MLDSVCKFYSEKGRFPTEEEIDSYLYNPELPPLDFIIRTGGEQRLSNFMLWQASYAEMYFEKKYWPEFSEDDLQTAIQWFLDRERRFGAVLA